MWMYRTAELNVPAVIKQQIQKLSALPAPKSLGKRMETLDITSGLSQLLQGQSRQGSSHGWLGPGKPQSYKHMSSLLQDTMPDSLPIKKLKHVQPVSHYHCKLPLQVITIKKSEWDI